MKVKGQNMNIGEFSKKLGFSASTIRFYENRGFFSGSRKSNGYRSYSDKDLKEGELIKFGKTMGFTLSEIFSFAKDMRSSAINHKKIQSKLKDKIQQIDEQILVLKKAKSMIQKKIRICEATELKEFVS